MFLRSEFLEIGNKPSNNKLLDAAIELWKDEGHEAGSARQLSARAAVPVSSIYHHFGSLEQLFVLAQEQAQGSATRWCSARLVQLVDFPASSQGFPAFFAGIVDDWVHQCRDLAFAWREGQLLRTDNDVGAQVRMGWRNLWHSFWEEACARFNLSHAVDAVDRLFENESFLHMLDWRRAVDRAGLDEFARGVSAWLTAQPSPDSPWRDFARAQALAAGSQAPAHDGTTARIAQAAASLIEQSGPVAVTHRAVAQQAGLTLGVVSHKLRTKAELLQAGFEATYARAIDGLKSRTDAVPPTDPGAALDGIADFLAGSLGGRGMDALHLVVARDPALRPFGLQLRYLRGVTSRHLLTMLQPDRPHPTHLEAAILSAFLSSLSRGHSDDSPQDARPVIHAQIAAMIAMR